MIEEINRRRTFAIVSHPDAGKTTLTEKFLLFGGQIQVAGAVKSNKIRKTATSDWMDIEKQRGISVTTSVMEFDYEGYKINILDTPGHQDFAEDTFRTLTAVDSVIIVIDSAKGVELQTRRLMEVCRMRKTPVIVFVNKLDREGNDPFDLLDELEEELRIHVRPLSWPIEKGARFKGVYNIYEQKLDLFTPDKQKVTEKVQVDIISSDLETRVGEREAQKLRSDLELIDGVYEPFDREQYLSGELAPVFFGSALNNFGVQELLNCFVQIAPSPRPTQALERMVDPEDSKFTGFIFKITANIDPNHRSSVAFCKVCSGRFQRNEPYYHVRLDKTFRFSSDLGFINWKKLSSFETDNNDYVEFDGFNGYDVYDSDNDDTFDQLEDDFEDMIKLDRKIDEGKKGIGLDATFRTGAEYTLPPAKWLSFGELLTLRTGTWPYLESLTSVTASPCRWFDFTGKYGVSTYGSSLGMMLNFHPSGFNFFVAVDRLSAELNPQMIPVNDFGVNVSFGLNLVVGK